jgi:hypothetical protein
MAELSEDVKEKVLKQVRWPGVPACVWGLATQSGPAAARCPTHSLASQVDFYFSDSNLPKDKFLLQQVKDHPEGCEYAAAALASVPLFWAALACVSRLQPPAP